MIVKDTWSEAGFPTQNPVEQGAVRILKNAADIIITRTGAPSKVWPWIYSYIGLEVFGAKGMLQAKNEFPEGTGRKFYYSI